MNYMLDTNIISYINTDRYGVNKAFAEHRADSLFISSIVLAEMEFGACKSKHIVRNRDMIKRILTHIEVLPFDEEAAIEYGIIRADLERKGTKIGSNDMLIAAHARSRDLTLVTNNIREFGCVDGLKVENWIEEGRN